MFADALQTLGIYLGVSVVFLLAALIAAMSIVRIGRTKLDW